MWLLISNLEKLNPCMELFESISYKNQNCKKIQDRMMQLTWIKLLQLIRGNLWIFCKFRSFDWMLGQMSLFSCLFLPYGTSLLFCVSRTLFFFSEVLLTFHLIISLTGSSFALSSSFIFQYSKKLSKVFLIVLIWPTTITKKLSQLFTKWYSH